MPEGFEKCRKAGGRIRTVTPKAGTYIHICWDKSGKAHRGEVHHSKNSKGNSGASRLGGMGTK